MNLSSVGSQFAATFLGLFSSFSVLWSLFLMAGRRIGYTYYTMTHDDDHQRHVTKKLNALVFSSGMTHQRGTIIPSGLFIGSKCIGYMSDTLSIYTSDAYMKELLEEDVVHDVAPASSIIINIEKNAVAAKRNIVMWSRSGNYSNIYYNKLKIRVDSFLPKEHQAAVIQDIISIYKKKGRATIFLEGVSGSGKSTIGLLLAKELGGSMCHTFNPTNPGDSLHYVYDYSAASDESPLILMLEEINMMLHMITENKIPLHKNLHTMVYNKSTFNTFLDDMCMYKNIILIMTSNESKQKIDEIDCSYLRKGRVDASFVMSEVLEIE